MIDGRKDVFDSESRVPHGQDLQANKADYEEELKALYSQWKTEIKINDYSELLPPDERPESLSTM